MEEVPSELPANEENDKFDEVMFQVGNNGKFQNIYNILFNFVFVAIATLATFSPIISLAVPRHTCQVPGREFTNFSMEQWKNLTIPRKVNNPAEFHQCKMYNLTVMENNTINIDLDENITLIDCLYGWDYDNTYYLETIVTQENWVCGNEMNGPNFLVFGRIGEILGTIFSQLGDIYGRRPILYVSIVTIIIGRLGLLISNGMYWVFLTFSIIGSLPSLSLYQTSMVVSVEISSVENRAVIPLFQCLGWTTGLCIGPLIFWIFGDWVSFTLISTLPLILFLFMQKFMIESPRWLASRGDTKRCVIELKKIAKINNTTITDKILMSLNRENEKPVEKNYGMMSLFSSRNLAKKTILIIISWVCYMVIYVILFLNVSNLEGNPFLNYFWQGLAELPGYFLGKYLCDSIGRKLTKFVGFIGIAITSTILAYFLTRYAIVISICGIILKFLSSVEFYALNLQTLEIYPTCLRQTGSAVGFLMASIFGIFTPYIIYLGTSVNACLPYVFSSVLAVIGAIFGIWLPETLNEKLPETINEANHFGMGQKLWSLPNRNHRTSHTIVSDKII